MNKYRVTLTAEERTELERLVSVGKGAARKLTHARILLLADTAAGGEHADEEIVAALRVGLCTVGRVRQRLVTQGLPAALNPRAQPQRPDKLNDLPAKAGRLSWRGINPRLKRFAAD